MIKKVMTAVKSSNKKRGRNITIGAVVGMLLSCTAVIKADDYLWIRNNNGVIEFSKDSSNSAGTDGKWGRNPYPDNSWNGSTYTNNITLSGTDNGKGLIGGSERTIGYGLRLSGDLGGVEFINNGIIIGTGIGTGDVYGYGIYNSGNIKSLKNIGIIIGDGDGIFNSGDIKSLKNIGIITGTDIGSFGSGTSTIGNITNTGVIYGGTNAIKNNGGTITKAHNYGLLVSSNGSVVENVNSGTIDKGDKYGLAFKIESDKYILDGDYSGEFGKIYHNIDVVMGYLEDNDGNPILNSPITEKYTIINAKTETKDSSTDVIGTESLVLADGKLTNYNYSAGESKEEIIDSNKKYILNGITNTLEVTGRHNELNNSVINALETALVMDKDMTMLTLNNTVVNGNILGITDISTVNIGGTGNTLTVSGDSVINTKDKTVAITVDGNNNAVTLEGNAIVNGEMKSTGKNTLNLNGTAKDGMNMLHNIDGFVNMNIDNSVTFFEDVKVTGTDTVTVKETGVLNLRLKKKEDTTITYDDSSIPEATHSFSGTNGMLIKGNSPTEAGTLNFLTNGIGREILVDMKNIALVNMDIRASSIIDKAIIGKDYIHLGAGSDLDGIINPRVNKYNSLNKIYKSIYSSTGENLDGLRDILSMTYLGENYDYNNAVDEKQLINLMTYLDSIYTGNPYSYSSELSRRSVGMFRDIVTENQFRPNLNNWLIMGGLTHNDGGTKDTYYGKNYYEIDSGSSSTNADMKLTGAYMLAKYGYSENTSLGLTLGENKSEAKLDMSKVKGNSGYLGAFAENYRGNLTLKAGAGVQYSEYDADRAFGGYSYSDKYSDMTYDIYLNGRYSNPIRDNLFLEPYGTLSYTYTKQDGADEGSKALAIETDSKSFDYTVGKVGVDLKKIISHSNGKSTLTAGVSYTKIFDGAEEETITGRFKGGSNFDILVAHKNQHSIGLNAKYTLELENGILFDVKGTYSVERDSHNGSEKNKTKGEWIVGTGLGYKF